MHKRTISLLLVLALMAALLPNLAFRAAASDGASLSSPIEITFGQTYTKRWTSTTDDFCYNKITLAQDGILEMEFTKPVNARGKQLRLNLVLYDSASNEIINTHCFQEDASARDSYLLREGLRAGTYYLAAAPYYLTAADGTIQTQYTFRFLREDCELEPNGEKDTATPMEPGRVYRGFFGESPDQVDWYRFSLKQGETVRLSFRNFSHVNQSTTALIYLVHNSTARSLNAYLRENVTSDGTACVDWTAEDGGLYYIRIENYFGEFFFYALSLQPGPADPAPDGPTPFVDVKQTDYFCEAVLWAVRREPQVTAGVSKTVFAPNAVCTREQVATFLWRAAGCPAPKTWTCPFRDVRKDAYYEAAILWAVETGVTEGVSATKFGVGQPCTRGLVVTFLCRAKGSPRPRTGENPFQDVAAQAYYYQPVLWAVENGVTAGTGRNRFSPNDTCTRGQIVTFLYRVYHEGE